MLKPMPESLLTVLLQLQPRFKKHLETDFKILNDMRCSRATCSLGAPNVLTIIDSESRLIKNIKFMKHFNIKIKSLDLCMKQLYLKLSLEIEEMLIEAQYEMFNNESKPQRTFNEPGNIVFDLNNVVINAVIPIYVGEYDTFEINENFSMSMIPERITTRKSSNVNGKVETLESVDTEIEKSLINVIWNGLSETISHVLRQEFSAGIVEYSINELFDDPEEMLAFSKKRLKVARIVMNTIFGRASLLVDDSIIKIPDLNLSYKSPTTSKLTLICFQSGTLLGLANIHLSGKYCITREDATTISLCGGFEVRELSMLFSDCWVVYDGIENIGNCKLVSCKSKFLLKILLEKKGNKYCPKLDNVQLCWIRQMECDFVGLPCLTNDIRKELQSYVEDFLYGEIQPMMINYFKERFEGVLKKYKIARHIKNIP